VVLHGGVRLDLPDLRDGHFFAEYWVSGTSAGAIAGLFIHDLVELFVTPLA